MVDNQVFARSNNRGEGPQSDNVYRALVLEGREEFGLEKWG